MPPSLLLWIRGWEENMTARNARFWKRSCEETRNEFSLTTFSPIATIATTIISAVRPPVGKSRSVEFRREAFDVVNKGASGAINGVMTNQVYEGRSEWNFCVGGLKLSEKKWKLIFLLSFQIFSFFFLKFFRLRQKINKSGGTVLFWIKTKLVWKMLLNLFRALMKLQTCLFSCNLC